MILDIDTPMLLDLCADACYRTRKRSDGRLRVFNLTSTHHRRSAFKVEEQREKHDPRKSPAETTKTRFQE
jgi:hypothetical protein